MSKQREALQMALQALEEIAAHYPADWEFDICVYAKNLLREALAEPEQEPVAWLSEGGDVSRSKRYMDEMGFTCEPLYTAPPTRKPLTDEQIDAEFNRECWVTVVFADGSRDIALDSVTARDFARAIERAHGIGGEE